MTQKMIPPPDHSQWVIMAKALRGELSEAEKKDFSIWLNADEKHAQLWADASDAWDKTSHAYDSSFEPDAELAWDKTASKLSFEPSLSVSKDLDYQDEQADNVKPLFAWNNFMRYAAAILALIGLGWLAYAQWLPTTEWTSIATLSGERKLVYLPDSSMATLNENSTLSYQTIFSGDNRQVKLAGEAFFEVRKNSQQPFIISSGPALTKVLGTSFNVRALKNSDEVTVAVVSGKVALINAQTEKEVVLLPGFTGSLKSSGQLLATQTNVAESTSWRILSFDNTSLQEVANQLSQFFGVSVSLASPSLQNCSFTGTFDQPNLTEIFKVLAASSDVSIKKLKSNTFAISGLGCQ